MLAGQTLLTGSYDYRLVTLSVVIAICASYAALDLAGRVTAARGRARTIWLTCGATAMGLGIWSMHYIGMLAFSLPIPVSYDWPTVLLSLLAAILASAVALYVVSRQTMNLWRAAAGSAVMGAGIAAMHYIGMAAMRLAGMCRYDAFLVTLSVILAIVISFAALWLSFLARDETKNGILRKMGSAGVMGAAIPVMHYTGMAAASFTASASVPDLSHAVGISTLGVVGITLVTLVILGLAVLTSVFNRRFSAQASALEVLVAAVEASPDAMTSQTLQGVVLTWNKGAEKVFGYSAAEAVGKSIGLVCPPERARETGEILERVLRGETLKQFETVRVRKDGKRIPVALTISPIKDPAGEIVAISGIAQDISERKQLEEQYRQAQKMEAVGRLSGGIAHDFNNLLGVIIGYSEVLEERLGENRPLRKNAEEIKKAGRRATNLTRQLLAFSRQQMLNPAVLDLNVVVADIEKMLRRLIGEDIELNAKLAARLGRVRADQGQIEQVLMNLAVNARDAMPEGGKLTIETANVELDENYARQHPAVVPGFYVLLAVTDTGTGMDAETQAHIFEPFFTTKEMGKGTGLGLATVYGVVKQSDGYIWVDSEPGQGTAFKIYLPQVGEPVRPEEALANASEGPLPVTETVLVVEDEDSLRELAHLFLSDAGYRVLDASSPARAAEIGRGHRGPIHLLLSDVVMPGMSGPELARGLTALRPEMRVLFMSGYTGDSINRRGLLDTGMRMLQKPFARDALLRSVREALELESAGSPLAT